MVRKIIESPSVEDEAARLEDKFGDLAPVYAETREEAARLRGAEDSAERWHRIDEAVEDEEAERQSP